MALVSVLRTGQACEGSLIFGRLTASARRNGQTEIRLLLASQRCASAGSSKTGGTSRARTEENDVSIDVFAVRSADAFTWEVRRFGGLVVAQGDQSFVTGRHG